MRFILLLFLSLTLSWNISGQNFRFSRHIIATDTITDDGVTFAASSDDAEQQNDEIDALFDDDIDAGWEGAPDDQNILIAGLRFQNIYLPQGAIIDSAYIIVHSHESKSAQDVAKITISAHAADHAETFNETDLITDRNPTFSVVKWEVAEDWGLWTAHRTPDLKSVIQEIVDRNGWKAGNAMAFVLAGENQGPSEDENAREWESFENIADPEDGGDGQNHPERVPELVIYYSVKSALAGIPIIATDTITDNGVTFAASSDDAEQQNDEIDALFDDDIDAGWEGAPDDQNILIAGLRFQNVYIPQGAVIDSCFIEVYSHESKSAQDVAIITISAEATDHAETFTETDLISDRVPTGAKVKWEVAEDWGLWTAHKTPDLKDIVKEIINRNGWKSGNAIAFVLSGENQGPSEDENAREWESYENIADPEDGGDGQNHPERVPRLLIYYSSPNLSTSVSDEAFTKALPLHVYPNPASRNIHIELENISAATIQILNQTGQNVHNIQQNYGKHIEVNTAAFAPGMYIILAQQNQKLYYNKVIISH